MKSFEEIPDIAERIKRSKMELQESGFYWAPEWDSQSCCDQDYVNNFKKGWQYRQTEVDELQEKLDASEKTRSTLYEENVDLRDKNAELQKRVDAAKYYMKNIFSGDAEVDQCHLGDLLDILGGKIVDEIEQALKGGE